MGVEIRTIHAFEGRHEELFDQLRNIWRRIGWTKRERSNAEWEHDISRSLWVYIACYGERVVGFVRFVDCGSFGCIFDVAVDPDYQRQGIGSMLMTELDKTIAKGGPFPWNDIILVPWEDNPGNIKFYKSLGYEVIVAMSLKRYTFPEA